MKVGTWLVISKGGSIRTRKSKPWVRADEVAMKLLVDLPDALFQKPHLEAAVTIPNEAAMGEVLTAEVVENAKEAIETATGLNFSVSVVQEEGEEDDRQS